MKQIVECIPNFSEGRRLEVVDEIVAAIESVAGVKVLDCSSDPDHNRTVITFVGSPETVGDAAFAAIARAAELIDMDRHQGEHPRMGATDVVPFVPIAGVTMDDCVEIARQLGARVGKEVGTRLRPGQGGQGWRDRDRRSGSADCLQRLSDH